MDGLAETCAPATAHEIVVISLQLLLHLSDVFLHWVAAACIYIDPSFSNWYVVVVVAILAWSSVASSLYIASVQPKHEQVKAFITNIGQIQILREARKAMRIRGESDHFQMMRLLEAILESAPMSVMALYLALLSDILIVDTWILYVFLASGLVSVLSLTSCLLSWEYKVCGASIADPYVYVMLGFRLAEVSSRIMTLALLWVQSYEALSVLLVFDFTCMFFLVVQQGVVQVMYSPVVAIPLIFVSLEPAAWAKHEHAVPKEYYYTVRLLEFVLLYIRIGDPISVHAGEPSLLRNCYYLAAVSTAIMCVMLPLVWSYAKFRRYDLSKIDAVDDVEESKHPFMAHIKYSDMVSGSDDSNAAAE